MNLSPLAVEMLMWFYAHAEPFPNLECDAQKDILEYFLDEKLIHRVPDTSFYRTTERGQEFVKMICATPLPVFKWLDPRMFNYYICPECHHSGLPSIY